MSHLINLCDTHYKVLLWGGGFQHCLETDLLFWLCALFLVWTVILWGALNQKVWGRHSPLLPPGVVNYAPWKCFHLFEKLKNGRKRFVMRLIYFLARCRLSLISLVFFFLPSQQSDRTVIFDVLCLWIPMSELFTMQTFSRTDRHIVLTQLSCTIIIMSSISFCSSSSGGNSSIRCIYDLFVD